MLHCINSSIVFYITWFSFEKRKSCIEINNSVQTYSYVFSIRCGKTLDHHLAGRLIQKQQQYLSDVVNGAFYDFCYVFLCAWKQVGSTLTYVPFLYVKQKKTSRYCTATGFIESTWIYLYHIIDNRKLVITLYTQDNRKNITEMTYVICMHGDY